MALLELQGLTKRFGGLAANQDISFTVERGQMLGLIGPNGAGKSTLFDLITGFQRPSAGDVRFEGTSLAGWAPERIARLGVARTFQKLKPFAQLTLAENVMVGALQHKHHPHEARDEALHALHFVGLLEKRNAYARTLSTGQRKRLELARALATRPRLLLMDEVTAGVDQRSIPGLVELVLRLKGLGVTLLIIEHNMEVLMGLADRVVALQLGEKIAEGTPHEIQQNRRVIDAYLGGTYV